ncbi:MAG: HNH endonuclease [Deltaproteobacteria bacterium]|nr:HNH endonuclease [Deltaproteobacteria bacterium]
MAALNNGFDRELPAAEGWRAFGSTQAPLRVWLRPEAGETAVGAVVALSQPSVARALAGHGEPLSLPLPKGACAARAVADYPSLHRLLRRALQLSRSLPDELLHAFEDKTRSLPRSTEAERLVVQRVGQDLFREGLLDYWEGRCAVTGLAAAELLRASHIKPWADCPTDAERLDVYNGMLLAPHLDAAFDRGLVTVADEGAIVVSPVLQAADRKALGLDVPLAVRRLEAPHRAYLIWHRQRVFRAN